VKKLAKKNENKDFFSGWTLFFAVLLGFFLVCFVAQKGMEYFQGNDGGNFSNASFLGGSSSKVEEIEDEDEDIKKAKQMKAAKDSQAENNSDAKNKSDTDKTTDTEKNSKQTPKPEDDEKLSIQDKIFISNQKLQEGKNFVAEGNLSEALDCFNQAVKLYSLNAAALTERGKIYTEMKNFEQALHDFNKAIEVDSTYSDAYKQRGIYYQNFGDDEKAQADLATAEVLSKR